MRKPISLEIFQVGYQQKNQLQVVQIGHGYVIFLTVPQEISTTRDIRHAETNQLGDLSG